MDDLADRVAFITGAASGIGFGIALACARQGMRVVMTDVREAVLKRAAAAVAGVDGAAAGEAGGRGGSGEAGGRAASAEAAERATAGGAGGRAASGEARAGGLRPGRRVLPLVLDVTDRSAWVSCVHRVEREWGPIGLLFSNAGVNFVGATHEATYEDWDFALGVNLGGALNAIRTIVPRMIAAGRGGHVVITSSVSGLFTSGGAGVYVTSKFSLVGLAESLRADLSPLGIGVSVLCPGPVKSDLFESTAEVRPRALAPTGSVPITPPGTARTETAIYQTAPSGDEVGERVLAAVRRNDLYVLTHPEIRPVLEARAAALLAAVPGEPVDEARIAASARLLDASLYRLSSSS